MRHKGTITTWNDEKGFGFVTPDGGGERVFLHISALMHRKVRPQESQVVTYELAVDDQQRLRAINVRHVDSRLRLSPLTLAALISIGFIVALLGMTLKDIIPWWIFTIYIGTSLVTTLEYGFDKLKAKRGKWRTSEMTLHILDLLGGWPGALIAQQIFRHKNRKAAFQIQFWVIVAIHLLFWTWFLVQRPDWLLQSSSGSYFFEPFVHFMRTHL